MIDNENNLIEPDVRKIFLKSENCFVDLKYWGENKWYCFGGIVMIGECGEVNIEIILN